MVTGGGLKQLLFIEVVQSRHILAICCSLNHLQHYYPQIITEKTHRNHYVQCHVHANCYTGIKLCYKDGANETWDCQYFSTAFLIALVLLLTFLP